MKLKELVAGMDSIGPDSMYSSLTSKKKAGFQNSGEDVQKKNDAEDEGYRTGNDLSVDSDWTLSKIIQIMLKDK
jgi:hypothetical protein